MISAEDKAHLFAAVIQALNPLLPPESRMATPVVPSAPYVATPPATPNSIDQATRGLWTANANLQAGHSAFAQQVAVLNALVNSPATPSGPVAAAAPGFWTTLLNGAGTFLTGLFKTGGNVSLVGVIGAIILFLTGHLPLNVTPPAPTPTPVPVPVPTPVPTPVVPPIAPPAPVVVNPPPPPQPAGTVLHATLILDQTQASPTDGAMIASDAALAQLLDAQNCQWRLLDVSDPVVGLRNLKTIVDQAGGCPVLIIQAEGTAIPLSVIKAPANADAIVAEVKRVKGP